MSGQVSVAIVGRPNVGKSRLFNRLAGKRISIVHDRPGVTRDVVVADSPDGFALMDTGGIGMLPEMTPKEIQDATESQADFAIQAANLLLFVVDGRQGLLPLDESLAAKFRKMGKSPVLVVNKIDEPEKNYSSSEFGKLGFENVVSVSAEHGHGVEKLSSLLLSLLPAPPPLPNESEQPRTRIAFIGRPNVGKSSLCNRLLNMERLIVSDVPGTTRETVELDLDYNTGEENELWKFRLFDTAGLKRRKRIDTSLDYFSAVRTKHAIEEVDIVFLVLDAREGVTKQDKILAGHVLEEGRALAILVNKWDLALESFRKDPLPGYEDEKDFRKSYLKSIRKELFFLPDSPVCFVSAKTGHSIKDFLQMGRDLNSRLDKSISTSALNKLIGEMWEHRPPAKIKGKRFKVFYAVHVENRPFRIKLFCNREHKLGDPYRRYLEKGIHQKFGLSGCPLKFSLAGKEARYTEEKKT
ncbi:MAG: ribosome biogenesis GTPase Der [Verrucomicrobiota bacterium]|nr:ribosome biogenesis GTPase Der [Verrucomicrobiota bacterium]